MRRIAIFFLLGLVVLVGFAAWLIDSGRWIPNSFYAAVYRVRGIDVSHHQGAIDWRSVATDHVDFAFIKATEGGDFVDGRFAENWKGSAAHGIPRGAYHFYNPARSGRVQARHFIAVVPNDMRALPPVVDLEFEFGKGKVSDVRKELREFIAIVRSCYGKEPILYTTEDFRRRYLWDYPISCLWIREVVGVPRGAVKAGWLFWQFSSRGRVRGVPTLVDLDVFSGSQSALDALTLGPGASRGKEL